MTELEKVAILLIALGPQHAQRILDRLSPEEMLPIIEAMRRVGKVPIEKRNAVLEEVNGILTDLAAGRPPRVPSSERDSPDGPAAGTVDLIRKLGPYLPERVDPGSVDWSSADPQAREDNDSDDPGDEDSPDSRHRP